MAQPGNDVLRLGELLVRTDIVGSNYEYTHPPIVNVRGIAGTILRVGPGCPESLEVDAKVAVKPLNYCRVCSYCREQNYIECVGSRTPHTPGATVILPVPLVTLLPPQLTLEEGTLIQPLALASAMIERANPQSGQRLVVFGASFIGNALCILGRRCKSMMMVVDTDEDRLNVATELVKVATCVVAAGVGDVDVAATVVQEFGSKPDLCINATGDEELMNVAMKALETGGSYVHAKARASEINWDVYSMFSEHKDMNVTIHEVVGWERANFGDAVEMIKGDQEVRDLIGFYRVAIGDVVRQG